jgi:UDP-galactopyranose mutase
MNSLKPIKPSVPIGLVKSVNFLTHEQPNQKHPQIQNRRSFGGRVGNSVKLPQLEVSHSSGSHRSLANHLLLKENKRVLDYLSLSFSLKDLLDKYLADANLRRLNLPLNSFLVSVCF